MRKYLIAIILALIFILGIAALAFATPSPVGIQGGYAYGAEWSNGRTAGFEPADDGSIPSSATSNVTVRYIIAQPFNSLDELNTFLDYYREHKRIIFVANGQKLNAISDNCKEMAKDLQDMAAKQGYDFPTETLTRTEMYKIYGKYPDRPHRINKAWIPGVGEWYYDFNTDK